MGEKFFYSKYFIIFLALVLILVVVALGRESYRNFRIGREVKDLEKKTENLKISIDDLLKTQDFFHSQEFLEKEARLKLNLIKPGEKLIIVTQQEEPEEKAEQKETAAKEISNIQRWWEYFFGKKL
jgi:cell division protein FtsB